MSEGWGRGEVDWGAVWRGWKVSGGDLSCKPHGQEGNGSSDTSAGRNSSQGYLEGRRARKPHKEKRKGSREAGVRKRKKGVGVPAIFIQGVI